MCAEVKKEGGRAYKRKILKILSLVAEEKTSEFVEPCL
jgi:hypothetical protein